MPANFSANFDGELFGLVFPGFQATQKIHAQNSRPELSAILSNFTFLNPKFIHGDFLLTWETNILPCIQMADFRNTIGTHNLDIFENPSGPPDPRSPKTPQQQKKEKFSETRKLRLSPKVNVHSPKVNVRSPKVNVKYSPKVSVKYL